MYMIKKGISHSCFYGDVINKAKKFKSDTCIKRRSVETPLTPSHLYACPKPIPRFLMSNTVIFIVFNDLRRGRRGRDRMAVGYTTTYAMIYMYMTAHSNTHIHVHDRSL